MTPNHNIEPSGLESNQVALLAGALGQSNFGDEALACAFMSQHRDAYRKILQMTEASPSDPSRAHRPPELAIGRNPLRGWWSRRSARRWVQRASGGMPCDYVWVGGLFGERLHVLARARELRWALSAATRLIYYFGDAEDRLRDGSPETTELIELLNRADAWIGVRSTEAAAILADVGLRHEIHSGVDPVLYDRVSAGFDGLRRTSAERHSIALCPAGVRGGSAIAEYWLAVARSAVSQGLRLDWMAFHSTVDGPICHELLRQTSLECPHANQRVVADALVVSEIEQAAICVSARYHAVIFASTAGVPTIAIGWNDKLRRIGQHLLATQTIIPGEPVELIQERLCPAAMQSSAIRQDRLRNSIEHHERSLDSLRQFLK